jgi:hypothetical protein
MKVGVIQCIVYAAAGISLAVFTFMSIMVGVWGVRISPLLFLAFFSSVGLALAGVVSLWRPRSGRTIALWALTGIGTVWIPSIIDLIPEPNVRVSSFGCVIFGGYFAIVAFGLFFPNPWKFSFPIFLVLCFTTLIVGAVAYRNRLVRGDYARPSFAFFRWRPGTNNLVIDSDPADWIDSETRNVMARAGIRGKLVWTSSLGERTAPHHVVLLAERLPSTPCKIFYPQQRVAIYVYDGSHWRAIPAKALTYSTFATLEPGNPNPMLWQDTSGGRQGSGAFVGWEETESK